MMDRRIWTVILGSGWGFVVGCAPAVHGAHEMVDPRMLDTLTATEIGTADAAARASAVALFRERQGQIRLRSTRPTWEGDPITYYVLVRDGAARWIRDARYDAFWGSTPRISDCPLSVLRLAVVPKRGDPWIEIAPAEVARYRDHRVYLVARAHCPSREPFDIYF